MRTGDYVALFLASIVAASMIVAELRDVKLSAISASTVSFKEAPGWRIGLTMVQVFRQFGVLPIIAASLPHVINGRGGDALSVCFNTVSIL